MPYLVRFDARDYGEGPSYLDDSVVNPLDGRYVDDPREATAFPTRRAAEKIAKREDHEWISVTTLDEALARFIIEA